MTGSASATAMTLSEAGPPPATALDIMRHNPLMNMENAYKVMAEDGLDGIICMKPHHIYHMTNFWPLLDKMGHLHTSAALLSKNTTLPPALIMGEFTHFYIYQNHGLTLPTEVFLYNPPAESDPYIARGDQRLRGEMPPPIQGRPFGVIDDSLTTEWELNRYSGTDAVKAAHGMAAGVEWAILQAAKEQGLTKGRIAVDDPFAGEVLKLAGFDVTILPAENVMRKIRAIRSPAEIAIHRIAAQQNTDAARAAAAAIQPGMTYRELRARFFAEAAQRGNTGVFMVVDRVSSDMFDREIEEGQALMIDCVSHFMHYHGDYARTIYVGEPVQAMKRGAKAMKVGWDHVRENLRPGVTFSEIRAMGREMLQKAGYPEYNIGFGPHLVGLFHGDTPMRDGAPYPMPTEITLEENMIVSIDCPIVNDGIGGSGHLEDLMLITKDGAEPIHSIGGEVITV